MTPEFAYFLKVNVAFILLYAFYRLFFYKDTFFKLRRTILLAFFGVSLLYPLMNIQDWRLSDSKTARWTPGAGADSGSHTNVFSHFARNDNNPRQCSPNKLA